MKKTLIKILVLIMCLCSLLAFAGCGHTHDYTIVKYNENSHWLECECGEKTAVGFHTGGTATCTARAKCEVCDVEYGSLKPHDYQSVETAPTATNDGFVTYTCCICKQSYDKVIVPVAFSITSGNRSQFGYNGYWNIPAVFNAHGVWYRVTSIGDSAFWYCTSLTSIKIPNSVTSIGDCAFYSSNLQTVTFGENSQLTIIGYSAFSWCYPLTSIEIPSSVTSIGSSAFRHCSNLQTVTFGENSQLTSIGYEAFYDCPKLTSIEIPNSVTSIGSDAFAWCDSLEAIEIPSSVTSIGDYAFRYCSNLQTVTFGGTIEEWKAVTKGTDWKKNTQITKVICSNGKVAV